MICYPDASLVVSAFTEEAASDVAERWMTAVPAGDLATSWWCETEVASALATKVRTGGLALPRKPALFALIQSTLAASATLIPIDRRHFVRATALLNDSAKPLRGGDALHLAIAAEAGATLFTLDRRMAEAGKALNLDVTLVR